MQEEKSAVYTVILGVCLLLCLLMLGNMLMGRADTSTAPAAPGGGRCNGISHHGGRYRVCADRSAAVSGRGHGGQNQP